MSIPRVAGRLVVLRGLLASSPGLHTQRTRGVAAPGANPRAPMPIPPGLVLRPPVWPARRLVRTHTPPSVSPLSLVPDAPVRPC